MLYHVSPNAGLKTLYPHVSSHEKAYVYAIENFVTGLLFGVKMDDFDLQNCLKQDIRFATHYKGIIEGLLTIMDGRLLQ